MADRVDACALESIDPEDVIRAGHGSRTFAVLRLPDGTARATEGLYTREKLHLAYGLGMDDQIECPKHSGRFNIRTGAALRAPVCLNLATCPARITGDRIETLI